MIDDPRNVCLVGTKFVGVFVGVSAGGFVAAPGGAFFGALVGCLVGPLVGCLVGALVGCLVGALVGWSAGMFPRMVPVRSFVGVLVGLGVSVDTSRG